MAPPRRYARPEQALVGLLAEARRRGYSFEQAWHATVNGGGKMVMTNHPNPPALALRWPTDRADRTVVQSAILSARGAFQRAYERLPPTPGDLAVVALHGLLIEDHDDSEPRERPFLARSNRGPRVTVGA
jgi:hypothetical protein